MSRHAVARPVQQRARSGHVAVAGVAVVVAAGVGAGSLLSQAGLVLVVATLQVALVWAWVMGTDLPGRAGGLLLGGGAAAAVDAALLSQRGHGLTPLVVLLGAAFPLLLVHQLARQAGRTRLTESLSGVAAGCVAASALALYLELARYSGPVATAALLATVLGLLAASLVDAAHRVQAFAEGVFHGLGGVLAAAAVGAAVAVLRLRSVPVPAAWAALLGGGVGLSAGLVAVGAGYVARSATPRRTAFAPATLPVLRVLLPLSAAAPVAYLLGLVVIG
ncbi:MAG: hypothetical protein HYR62_01490 [Actinobacteria bacterium]|nr:hypothetical protein [Actinomycetota bacterium]MBI3688849.1 hypothetical protein [Actinomycetota bacterium]